MQRKPKINNWLKVIIAIPIIILLVWAIYQEFFKSYPEVPRPLPKYTIPTDVPIKSSAVARISHDTLNELVESGIQMHTVNEDMPPIWQNNATNSNAEETTKERLETVISNLEQKKLNLEKEINDSREVKRTLEADVTRLSKISYDIQETMMKFVEKNRVRDMLASALVGAIISVFLTFVLSRPPIQDTIDNWLREKVKENENKS